MPGIITHYPSKNTNIDYMKNSLIKADFLGYDMEIEIGRTNSALVY
jgi:hypothetical protein